MKTLLVILTMLIIGCSSEAQQKKTTTKENKIVIKDGYLVSFEGINLSEYELDVEDFNVEEVSINHLLGVAIEECDEELVERLFEKGADVNFKFEGADDVITGVGWCKENGLKLAKLLLSKGANINGADEDNDSFLSYAIGFDNLELVKYLVENGADKNQRDTNRHMGCLPIHGVQSVEMLEFLISKGYRIDEQCDNGRTLLHFAAKDDLKEVAKYLVEKELVDIYQKDKKGETALDYAKNYKHPEITQIINKKK